ncbi:tetratricopeptide repeat protein [Phenylobacterium sp.]|uniref:tetratricopeptide repeat protein n=1 Tax=Phenylobacterium sp. TaxID=1871053 RepID=UPI00398331F7
MADLFEEVEEQLRSDRYRTLARKALPWVLAVLAAALIAALAYWGWDKYRQQTVDKASEQYAAALDAFNKGDAAQAKQLWGEVSKSSARGYKSLALMQLGGLQLTANKPTEAVTLFDQAAKAAPNAVMGDAARLKSAFAILDTAPYKDVEARLTPLMEDGHPYRVQAREALAFTKIMAGNTAGARGDFVVISGTLDAPEGARARAKAAIDLIDSGSAKAVAATVRSAATLPPPLIVQPGATIPGLPAPPQQEAPASQ